MDIDEHEVYVLCHLALGPNPLYSIFQQVAIKVISLSISPNQLKCVPATSWDAEEAESEEEERKDEGDLSRQVAMPQLSSTYKATSLPGRPSRSPWGDPDQISTCPHCHLALPLSTLSWHKVTSLHHKGFLYTLLKSSYGKRLSPALCPSLSVFSD